MVDKLLNFIYDNPSVFHCIDTWKTQAINQGYKYFSESKEWDFTATSKIVVTRNSSSIALIDIPHSTLPPKGFRIYAAHCDSPTFKIKENPEMVQDGKYVKLNTEKYGGMILSTWLDRPLSIAGRVFTNIDGFAVEQLVNIDEDLLVIPNLAIHMNRDMNTNCTYNPQIDMLPLMTMSKDATLNQIIADELHCNESDILAHDLFLYVREPGKTIGMEKEFILSPRLDDIECAFCGIEKMLQSDASEYVNICVIFDNEEVGSDTRQGADSTFLSDIIDRIKDALDISSMELQRMLANSLLLSADNAHAVHPNHPEKADPTNRPYLNDGIVIKYHGGAKYTTDGKTAAEVKLLCKKASIPYQTYTNRSDIAGGSTLGNISISHVSIPSADIGIPQLAMHSAVETAGANDIDDMLKLLAVFFAS